MSRIIVKNLPPKVTEAQLRERFSVKGQVTDVNLVKDHITGEFRKFAFIGFREPQAAADAVKYFDKTFVNTCRIAVEEAKSKGDPTLRPWGKPRQAVPEEKKEVPEEDVKSSEQEPKLYEKVEEDYDTSRLFLRNLSYTVTQEDIQKLFEPFGEITELTLPITKRSQQVKGFAYVKFSTTEAAVQAFNKLDATVFQGRLLHILPAKKKPEPELPPMATPKSSLRQSLQERVRERAKDESSWNTLFLNQDAVATAMSRRLHVKKGELMDKDADDLAVRLSRAETKILGETKEWMTREGINLQAFETDRRTAPRSDSILIVKNLAPTSRQTDLQEIFGRYGSLGRVSLAPSGTIAIVEFLHPDHAKNAFDRVSMQKYMSLPIYLEWAPVQAFEAPYKSENTVVEDIDTKTIFIKNLDFKTTKEALEAHMASAGTIKSVKVVTKNGLPCGYGFVEYEDEKGVKKALRNLNNSVLDGHALKLSVAKSSTHVPRAKREREEVAEQEPTQTKMLVKNLAFEATAAELKALFTTYGQVKTVRLPKKYAGGHRGFAFVEFVSAEEAAAAFETLKNTHMYGRKLVIEWAKQEDSLGEARKRAKILEPKDERPKLGKEEKKKKNDDIEM
eukprot:CAMPEP_0204905636 /NCGR_PEP_ID=MMETSP1397-20131031/5530_1 /ASSEMBLY_ACC=CAM_ASM_000891 /TAXON_ID=49980 /ORGANISM="Climacostomum Climacostomum virens, Strain Stock W-24" /LENGTH=618 /DNA_ID=CAMNT_0052074543 /DNA_START=1 /DNA_END=1857 /DNA_ORIENTATION=-